MQTYRKMKVLDELLDNAPTEASVKELAELRIQNLLCFRELEHLNETGELLGKHPLLLHQAEYEDLLSLWRSDKEAFIRKYENCRNSIRRYNGRANRKGISETQREEALALKAKHQQREMIFKKIISNESNTGI